jgi:MFS transporter, ACS family, hexuronate transporter
VSVINYLDRQTLSILARTIQNDLGITDGQYAIVVQAFLLTYLVMHVVSGRVVDRLGPRIAETLFICWWSVANICTGFTQGFASLMANRMLLGIGEPGHYSASGKAVAEWFPPKEKGIAVAMYVMGGTIGAAIAAPLLAWLALEFGWRAAFVITGAAGFVPALIWYTLYRSPSEHKLLGQRERTLLSQAGLLRPKASVAGPTAMPFLQVLRLREAWPVMFARLVTDPLWLFYLFWFPKYLQDVRGFSLQELGMWGWTLYAAADVGAISGGWLSGFLVRRGFAAPSARMALLALSALILAASFLLPHLSSRYAVLAAASLFAWAEMSWMTNCVTLPLDLVPKQAVGSVQGIIGAAGSLGGLISTPLIGWSVSQVSYTPVFAVMSLLHPVAFLALYLTLKRGSSIHERT